MLLSLKATLLTTYGIAAAIRPNGSRETVIRIDDRHGGDVYPGFCHIHVILPQTGNELVLQLLNAPCNDQVRAIVQRHGGTCLIQGEADVIRLPLRPKDHRAIRQLASAIRGVTRRGQHYLNRWWKWICPRTADSLKNFADHLAAFSVRPPVGTSVVGGRR